MDKTIAILVLWHNMVNIFSVDNRYYIGICYKNKLQYQACDF